MTDGELRVSHRAERVASTLRKAVQESLSRGVGDPRVRGMVTVTEVDVTPDLLNARVFVSVLPSEYGPTTVKGLGSAAPRIQRAVNDRIHMRRIPRIEFVLDERLKKQAEVLAAINRAVGGPEGKAAEDLADKNQAPRSGADDLMSEFEPPREKEPPQDPGGGRGGGSPGGGDGAASEV